MKKIMIILSVILNIVLLISFGIVYDNVHNKVQTINNINNKLNNYNNAIDKLNYELHNRPLVFRYNYEASAIAQSNGANVNLYTISYSILNYNKNTNEFDILCNDRVSKIEDNITSINQTHCIGLRMNDGSIRVLSHK